MMEDTQLDIHSFEGAAEGPSFTAFGAVHGNEKCGTQALTRILKHIEDGDIEIIAGKFTTIPICNPRAYKQDVRFVERNLNRFMSPKENPEHYEDHLDNVICPVLDQTDFLLDLHSYSSQGEPFILLDFAESETANFGKMLGVPRCIYGWADAMKKSDDVVDKHQSMGTCEYTREQGGVALTMECGTHGYERAADFAFEAVLNALESLKIAKVNPDLHIMDLPNENHFNIKMRGARLKQKDGDFTEDWTNMHPVKEGTVIARYDDGEELIIPKDGYVVLPNRKAGIGHEWFFWGIEQPFE
ncbi:MAG: succinylglutamate desuccinylase [Micavibrio sp.]|nr:MAG: succinylglutamate desuccinylase [Micavibrio sp.]